MNQPSEVSFRTKFICLAVAWILAVIGMALVEGGQLGWQGILLPPAFSPPGFLMLLLATNVEPRSGDAAWHAAAFIGWLYYIWLTIWGLVAKRSAVFGRLFLVLCLSFLFNIAGCESMKYGLNHGGLRTGRPNPHELASKK